jgi:hypothetical protein
MVVFCEIYRIRIWNESVVLGICVRRSLGLPNLTHSALFHILSGTLPIFDELIKRTTLFIRKCLSSDSESVRTMARMSVFAFECLRLSAVMSFYVAHDTVSP